jgi:ribA/ribD-fused uncharacterized protein
MSTKTQPKVMELPDFVRPEDFAYVVKNNLCLFYRGYLSQWWGGFKGQRGGFVINNRHIIKTLYLNRSIIPHNTQIYARLSPGEFDYSKTIAINCCEQYMMMSKAVLFDDVDAFDKILKESHPGAQKELGRGIKNFDPVVWNRAKLDIVYEANRRKFVENPDLRDFLLSFGPHIIFAEASPSDLVWGIGLSAQDPDALDVEKWKGENLLGKVLTMLRDEFIYGNNFDHWND